MNRTWTLLIGLALATAFIPPVDSAESASRAYIGGGAQGFGIITCWAPGQGIDPDNGIDQYPECEALRLAGYEGGVGGTDLIVNGLYANTIVSASDDLFGSDVGMVPCFYNPDGDLSCDEDDYPGVEGCGTQALLGAPFVSNFVSLFTMTALVMEDLTFCGATSGTATADLF